MSLTHRLRPANPSRPSAPRLTLERMEDRLTPSGIPVLNSNPGAPATLYLDFDGHFEATWGSYSNITTPAYDSDGDPAGFGDLDTANMQAIWARVAEDFAPFNINVTTVEPAVLAPGRPVADANGKALRVAIGGNGSDWHSSNGTGGVGYINAFTSSVANVCYVFPNGNGNRPQGLGDLVSHEAGHSFGLRHQSSYDANGAETSEYYGGTLGVWSPVMGISVNAHTTWYNGTTTSATTYQDDMAVLANTTNGFGYRADDHGNTAASATPLAISGGTWTGSGRVGTNTDVDYFSFTVSAADTYRLFAGGLGADANLDAVIELRNSAGQVLEVANPSGSLDATIVRPLAPGNYTLAVKSSGVYGYVGSYTVSIDTPLAAISVIPATAAPTTGEDGRTTAFTVVLATAPTTDVVIPVYSSNPGEGAVSVSSLTFTPANWNVPQTVTITGVADGVADGDAVYTVVLGTPVTTDAEYAALDPADLAVMNVSTDDDGFLYRSDLTNARIVRTRLDGSHEQTLVDLRAVFGVNTVYGPRSTTVDVPGGKIYWTDEHTRAVYRANLDGSGAEQIVTLAGKPFSITLDSAAGKLYWAEAFSNNNTNNNRIQRANLDGTGVEDVLTVTGSPNGLALAGGKMYWTENTAGVGTLRRADLIGGNVETLWSVWIGGYWSSTRPVAVDLVASKVYWVESTLDQIYRANLDGSGVEVVVNTAAIAPNSTVIALTLDVPNGLMYWQDFGATGVFRASLDGSNVARLATATYSFGMAIVRLAPGVSVTGRTGLTTAEGGAGTSFQVVLTARPTANVTIPVSSSDTTEGTVSVTSLTFTPDNWFIPQTVTVSSVEDTATDGNVAYTIVLGVAVSGDPVFHGMNPADATVTSLDNDFNKFFVVDDASTNRTYRYGSTVNSRSNATLNSGNSAPRGAATTAAGDKVWVIDANKKVYVYNSSTGALLGSWTANSLPKTAVVEGITVWGTDVWVVDAAGDRVYRYANAAGRTSGSQNATSNFALHANNISPKDLVTDGVHIWVVDDQILDRVYKYTLAGTYVGRWSIDPANGSPTGITLDPANPRHLWIVDNGTDRVYQYDDSVGLTSGSKLASTSYPLAAGNTNPQGIADPPPGIGEPVVRVLVGRVAPFGVAPTTTEMEDVGSVAWDNAKRHYPASGWQAELTPEMPTDRAAPCPSRTDGWISLAFDWVDRNEFDFAPIDVSGPSVRSKARF